jgi:hypothetical protein
VSPRAGKPTPGCRVVPGYSGSNLSHDIYRNSVISDLRDPNGRSMVCVRNKSPAG